MLAQSAVEATLVTLANAKDATYGEQLGKLVVAAESKLAEGENEMEFQSVSIGELQDGISALNSNADRIAERLSQELTARFGDVLSESSLLVRALKVLDIKVWPETKEDLYEFSKAEMTLILDHFAAVLNEKVDCTEVLGEWLQLKIYISSHMQHLSAERCWASLSTMQPTLAFGARKFSDTRHMELYELLKILKFLLLLT